MEHWRNDTDMGQLKYWEKNLPQYHFLHHKSPAEWPGSPRWEVSV